MADVQDQAPVAGATPPPLDDAPARLRFRSDAPDDGPLVPLADFLGDSNAAAVRLDPADDARVLLPVLGRVRLIEVAFPKFRDGRGYSSAKILREAGYTGELRAAGDVLLDQIVFMRRVGFDSFAPARRSTRPRSTPRWPASRSSIRSPPTASRRSGRSGMAKTARIPDVIDTAPAFTAADAARLTAKYAGVDTGAMLADLLAGELKGRVAAVSSFGAESAVLLDMVAKVDRDVPVIFVNTQKIFGETLQYRDELAERLGFTDLRVYRPDPYLLAQKDKTSLRWSYDPDGCCDLRKVEPLRRALAPFDAWISGRKGLGQPRRPAALRDRRGPAEDQSARRLVEAAAGPVFRRREATPPPAGGAGLSVDRLRAVHDHGQARRGPALGPLARLGQDRVRHPRPGVLDTPLSR